MELESKPLDWWMRNLHEMSRDIWLWISSKTEKLSPETVCFIVDDGIDLSAEEQDQTDVDLENSGLMCFFFKDQLEDIQLNLKAQKSNYDSCDLYEALNYYWENDAFIDLKNV
ncbi:hypothetical protein [Shewanella chilikensis]|jgi:hypothetical protein|uniref:DUF7716 domain-containing protein n=1 Tax=Shewanella chilikensis TaxID=558541 RepID=UPI003999D720